MENDRNKENFNLIIETRETIKAEMILDMLFYGLPANLIFDIFKNEDKIEDRQLRRMIDRQLQEVTEWREKHPGVQSQFDLWVKNI